MREGRREGEWERKRMDYLIRPKSSPFKSTIFKTTISLSVSEEYLSAK